MYEFRVFVWKEVIFFAEFLGTNLNFSASHTHSCFLRFVSQLNEDTFLPRKPFEILSLLYQNAFLTHAQNNERRCPKRWANRQNPPFWLGDCFRCGTNETQIGDNCFPLAICSTFPCRNGGACRPSARASRGFLCDCPPEFSGLFCEFPVMRAGLGVGAIIGLVFGVLFVVGRFLEIY